MTIQGGYTSKRDDGAFLQQWHPDPSSAIAQLWHVDSENGYIAIRSAQHKDTYVGVSGASKNLGEIAQHHVALGGEGRKAQLFTFTPE